MSGSCQAVVILSFVIYDAAYWTEILFKWGFFGWQSLCNQYWIPLYFNFSIIITSWIYPPISHWGWHCESKDEKDFDCGWLVYGDGENGYSDFAGSGIVHVLGGVCAGVGCYFMKPRFGRFSKSGPIDMPGHSVPLAGLGGFILLFGFLAFNGGSQVGFL